MPYQLCQTGDNVEVPFRVPSRKGLMAKRPLRGKRVPNSSPLDANSGPPTIAFPVGALTHQRAWYGLLRRTSTSLRGTYALVRKRTNSMVLACVTLHYAKTSNLVRRQATDWSAHLHIGGGAWREDLRGCAQRNNDVSRNSQSDELLANCRCTPLTVSADPPPPGSTSCG